MGVQILGLQIQGVKVWTSQKFRFPTIIIFVILWLGGKNSLDYLEKKYGNIADIFAVLLRYFYSFIENLIISLHKSLIFNIHYSEKKSCRETMVTKFQFRRIHVR